ncbi:pantothenate kinase [Salipaludibacillus keqinensis]|uniref:Type III pantothenate kinase n=1 Tax=Salipaludibacillus keqinensis TaxID=2045207 RepID=A0A323TCL0_9BACI|nr:type III pantothenate kinase [Salipaludibacillus keqinensis]PYZ91567.1 pantothenate kinase [Salipaludibacillus keqinensis]
MNLVMDVGNTKLAIGVYGQGELQYDWTVQTDPHKTVDEYGVLLHHLFQFEGLSLEKVSGGIISSVFPTIDQCMKNVCEKYFQFTPLFIGPGTKTGLNIKYDNPREVGSDRIVNAVAGINDYDSPLIIVDLGTATTFCYINEHKEYVGGAIAPGMDISMEALYQHASKLPKIETVKAKSVIGKNTIHAMQSGYLYGFLSQIEGMIWRIKKEMNSNPTVVATGEMANIIYQETNMIDHVDEWLTLKGLQLIYERNQRG